MAHSKLNNQALPANNVRTAIIWFCLLLLATCTLLLSGIYHPTTIHYTFPYAQVVVLLAASVITAAVALRRIEFPLVERGAYPLLLALLIFIIFVPWPYRLPGILLAAGFLLTPVKRLRKIVQPAAMGLLFTGLVIAAQMPILPMFYLVFSRYHRLDFATPLLTLIVKAFGVEAHTSALFMREGDKLFSFLTTWDSLGFYPILNIWIGGLLTIWLLRQRWQKAVYLSAILSGYMFLRYAAAIFFFLNLQSADVFWKYEFTFLTLLPLAVVLPKWIPLEINPDIPSARPRLSLIPLEGKIGVWVTSKRLLPAALTTTLLVFSLAGVWGFHDPGVKKTGRILIDEKHSSWEWTTEEFDTKWYGQKSLYLDYAGKNFFPREKNNEETMEFGLFVQAAGVRFGKGRVLGFTDSTVWSNFYMHILGKPELLLGCMEWLNRQNSWWEILHYLFLASALGSLAFLLVIGRQISRAEFLWTAIGAIALALPISTQAFAFISRAYYPAPQPQRDFVQVNFEMEHSNYDLPILHITQNPEHSFHTFYTWLQRLGMVPAVKTKFVAALSGADVVVFINPHQPFSKKELQQFEAYLEAGGKALILDNPTGHSVANQLLANFGMRIEPIWSDSAAVFSWHNGADSLRFWGKLTGAVSGGTPLVYAEARQSNPSSPLQSAFPLQPRLLANNPVPPSQGERVDLPTNHQNHGVVRQPVIAVQRIGKGLLAVMSSSPLFTDREMGSNSVQPSPNMQKIYELEFWIFSELFGLGSRKS